MIPLDRSLEFRVSPSVRRRECGLSLIELMIAITLGLMVVAGMALVFANTSAARNEIDRISRQIENGRYAIELLREDIQLAGYFGETNMPLVPLPASPPGADPCSVDPAVWPLDMKLHVQGFDNVTAADLAGVLSCLPTGSDAPKLATDVIIIRRAKTCIAGNADCDAVDNNKPYLQVPLCSTETATHELAIKSAGTFAHTLKDCATPAVLRPYVVYFFYVGTDNILKRAEFTGAAIGNITPLVDGIENLQLDYGVDTNGDGAADTYQAEPATVADWANVVSVQINLLARNTELSPGFNDTRTYNLGASGGTVGPFNDARRRNVYSTMVRIQNPSGLRDTP
jgi:type IV pilus assembly protein PilW